MGWDGIIGVALLLRSVLVLILGLLSVSVSVSLLLSLWLNCPLAVLDSVDTAVEWEEITAVPLLRLFCLHFGFGFARSVCPSVSVSVCGHRCGVGWGYWCGLAAPFCFCFEFGFALCHCLSVSVWLTCPLAVLALWTPLWSGMRLLVWPCCAVLSLF